VQTDDAPASIRIGSVSFLNAKPLIYGLEESSGIKLHLEVPSRLLDGLLEDRFDVALLPVIDYQRMDGLRLITSGGIACDGPTLTVRVFSPTPIKEIKTLACDTDSHTSVALARVLLSERYQIHPEFVPLNGVSADDRSVARLLIGDKVVCEEPKDLPHQLDLGEAWKAHTGLPFVFACWMARGGVELGDLPFQLAAAKRDGLANVESIVERFARPRGWPAAAAREYLTHYLQFDITSQHLEAIRLFHRKAKALGLVPGEVRELQIV
jgi:chorismate dehydratase